MPYANNRGVQIRYEVEGAGPPLILQHGFTCSIEDWYEGGYVAVLKADHRLVLVDARGHGGSDKPRDSAAYTFGETNWRRRRRAGRARPRKG